MTACRAHTFIFVIYLGRRVQSFLKSVSSVEGRGPPESVYVPDLVGNVDPPLDAHLLPDQFFGEEWLEILRLHGLSSSRM